MSADNPNIGWAGPFVRSAGVSYANYAVLRRTFMQSMPIDWQERMAACLDELDAAYRLHPGAFTGFNVQTGQWKQVEDLTRDELRDAGITVSGDAGEPENDLDYETADGDVLYAGDYAFVPSVDPVPHYDRGRTYVAPDEAAILAARAQRAGRDIADGTVAGFVAEFHAALGQAFGDGGDFELRCTLRDEEHAELVDAMEDGDRVGIARELADVVYVAYGTAFSEGIDLDAVLAEVHRANMSKRGPGGKFARRADGKVLKGNTFTPPDVALVLERGAR